jgi:transposase-like protein
MTSQGRSSAFVETSGSRGRRSRVAVRWYLRYALSYRDVGELLDERGVTINHVTIYRQVGPAVHT